MFRNRREPFENRNLESRAVSNAPPDQTVSDVGEHALIRRIQNQVDHSFPSVILGIGDDAAVIEPKRGTVSVITTDTLVEGIHFDRLWAPMNSIGHKALAVSLSDLAAMGATPSHILLSLALPATTLTREVDDLVDGLLSLANRYKTALVGGNITAAREELHVEVTAVGHVKRRKLLRRTGAKPGDNIYVTGEIGSAAAGLASLRTPQTGDSSDTGMRGCQHRYLCPEPRVRLGSQLGKTQAARSCIDLSDGLADGVRQLAEADCLGARIDAKSIPLSSGARHWFESCGLDPVVAAITGGEDYELLFTASPSMQRRVETARKLSGKLPVTCIGTITKNPSTVLIRNEKEEVLPDGYQHLRTKP